MLAQVNIELVHDNPQHLSAAIHKQGRVFFDETDSEVVEFNFDAIEAGS